MIKNIIKALVVLIVLLVIIILVSPKDKDTDMDQLPTDEMALVSDEATLFFDGSQGIALAIVFEDGFAIMETFEGENIILTQTPSETGMRYVDEEGVIELFVENNIGTLTVEGMSIFEGEVFEGSFQELMDTMEEDFEASLSLDLPQESLDLLTGSVWVWQETLMNNDDVFAPEDDSFTLIFDTSGTVSGTTDCNNFGGSYGVSEDGQITFGELAMTRMFCEDSQEQMFVDMVTASQLVFFTEDDQLVLLLPFDLGSIIFQAQ